MSFKSQWRRDKLKKKAQKGFRGYPVATIAYYGPTDQRASKVVVGVVQTDGGEVEAMEKWFSNVGDVREDAQINEGILSFLQIHGAKSVVTVDRIMGCPHEEGIDYPEGEKCPQCAFWQNRDRWSGEVLR